jgi:hypothetical protein
VGKEAINDNLMRCYEVLIDGGWIDKKELPLVSAWIDDIDGLKNAA